MGFQENAFYEASINVKAFILTVSLLGVSLLSICMHHPLLSHKYKYSGESRISTILCNNYKLLIQRVNLNLIVYLSGHKYITNQIHYC